MAVAFQEGETLLPSEMFTDDYVCSGSQEINKQVSSTESVFSGFWSSCSSSSDTSTPVGSEFGSNESEEDDYIAELTRKMADFMLQGDDDENAAPNSASHQNTKSSGLLGAWKNHQDMKNPKIELSNQAFTGDQTKSIQNTQQHANHRGRGRRGKLSDSAQQLKAERQHQHAKHMQNRGRAGDYGNSARVARHRGQLHGGSGMRALFLGGSGSSSASSGTGVFLPRGTINMPASPGKKSGCSTVLIPARVLQALSQHFQNVDAKSNSNGCGDLTCYPNQHEVEAGGDGGVYRQQKRQLECQTRPAMSHQDVMQLPQEWTY
ncbi:hypothetical protein RJ640_015326 [Escallonia rubra]|uniref:Uncharacterized protein n=1 Tax=Escallonia rubra TaxID=112253 RepID=A0AA88RNB8_9ASTE|nr:hypothetical protein RJ640_015326 [Escallonia rubra]